MERPLTSRIREGEAPYDYDGFRKAGGYEAADKVLAMAPGDVVKAIKESNLRGRGGAGFPTGMKWSFVPMGEKARRPKYLVVNGDEMEPGTFKDRVLLEGDPHGMIESIICAAYAIEAEIAYIFLRWEYRHAARLLHKAIAEAANAGMIGKNIKGTGYSLDIYLHASAGRYICGEETALLNSLEGRRANPRAKPPFPQFVGLFGKPTIVQNVETLYNVPHIILKGADWFKGLSKTEDGGTKLYGVSGNVKTPGCWELPMGTPVREILEGYAGGMKDGYKFRGLLPGGASTDFLVEEHLDLPMDYKNIQDAGSRMGTGTMIVLDDKTCPVGMVHNLELFFAQESCGWCTPCRDGLPRVRDILNAMENGEGLPDDIETLQAHSRWLGPGMTFCALAPGAVEPLQSAIKYFGDDFKRHIDEKRCPWS
ncbi:NADH-quinone oxidoreductase subunit NuoF [bacterium]|nr:NADH-quinone oxidoreductase subunit NuoF [bacterium]